MRQIKLELLQKYKKSQKVYSQLSSKKQYVYKIFLTVFVALIFTVNALVVANLLNSKVDAPVYPTGAGYKDRDIFDFGGQISDKMIQLSVEMLDVEAVFLDNYVGSIPNPADYQIKDRQGNTVNLKTRQLMDTGVVIGLSILIFISLAEGFLVILSSPQDYLSLGFDLVKNIFIGSLIIIACPYVIKYIVDFVNALNQTIISNYLTNLPIGDQTLSKSIIASMGISSVDPNPNFVTYVGLSVVLLFNCFIIGINYFLFLFLSVISPLVFSFLPLHSGRKYIFDLVSKFFQCLMIWPAWIIGISLLIQIIHSSSNVSASTILGIIGLFGLTAIPSLVGGSMGSMSTMIGAGAFSFASKHLKNSPSEKEDGKDHKAEGKSEDHTTQQNIDVTLPNKEEKQPVENDTYQKELINRNQLSQEFVDTFRYQLPVTSPQNVQKPDKKPNVLKVLRKYANT